MKVDIKVIIIVVMSIVLMGNQGFFDDDEVGRYELFRDNVSGGKLYMVDITGHNEREVITPLEGSDPAWSPLMH